MNQQNVIYWSLASARHLLRPDINHTTKLKGLRLAEDVLFLSLRRSSIHFLQAPTSRRGIVVCGSSSSISNMFILLDFSNVENSLLHHGNLE
jgi:hypothetical protein